MEKLIFHRQIKIHVQTQIIPYFGLEYIGQLILGSKVN